MRTARAILAGLVVILAGAASHASAGVPENIEQARRGVLEAIDEGRFADAENAARVFLTSLAPAGEDQLDAADLLLDALIENGRGAEQGTQDLANETLRARQSASAADRGAVASTLGRLGIVLFQAGDYRRAVIELERARAIRTGASVADDAPAAAALEHLAMALLQLGRHDDALAASNRAVAIAENIGVGPATARMLSTRGMVYLRRGEYALARADLERAFAIQQARGARHPDAAMTLMLFGTQYQLEGDSVQARDFLERAVALGETTLRSNHPNIVWFVRILAVSVWELGDLARARTLQERAIAMALTSVGPDHPLTADCLQDSASTLLLQADFEGARSRYERALRIYERRLGSDYPETATVVYNLALLNAELGDFARARILHRRVIVSWEHTYGREHAIVARGLWEFGQTLADQGLDRDALPLFERALSIRRRTLGDDNVLVAETLSSIAGSLARLGEHRRALALSTQAMGIWDKAAAPDQAGFVQSLLAHAAALSFQGQAAAALDAYDRALRIQLPVLGSSHPDIAAIEVKRAALLAQTDRKQESLTVALGAEATGRQHLSLTLGSLPERQALDYAAKRPQGLGLALSLVTADSSASVLDAVVRGRSLVLDEMAIRRHAVNDEAGGPAASLWIALRQARQRLANLVIRGPGSLRPEQYTALISQAQQEKEDAERALGERSAAFRSEMSRSAIGLDEIRKRLPADSALVSLVRYDRQVFAPVSQTATPRRTRVVPSYLGFVLRSDGSDPIVVPLGPAAAIDSAVARWRRAMKAEIAADSSEPPSEPSLNSTGVGLRRQIWDPIAAQVGNAARVFVVPDGAFNLVPLAALPSGRGRYLVEDGPIIHYLSAERDLVLDETTPKPTSAGLLSVGGAAFSDGSSFASLRNARSPQGTIARANPEPPVHSLRDASINCGGFRLMTFEPIPASRNEAQVVAGLWRQFGAGQGVEPSTLQTLVGLGCHRTCIQTDSPWPPHTSSRHARLLSRRRLCPRRRGRSRGRWPGWSAAPASKSGGAERTSGPRAIPENPAPVVRPCARGRESPLCRRR